MEEKYVPLQIVKEIVDKKDEIINSLKEEKLNIEVELDILKKKYELLLEKLCKEN